MYNQQADTVFDVLQLQELQNDLNDAIAHGNVISFDELVKERAKDPYARRDEDMSLIVYTPSKYKGFGVIAANYSANEARNEIISTYNDILESVDVYLSWYSKTDANGNTYKCFDGLFIVPKKGNPNHEPVFCWSASATWPDDVKQPARPQSAQ
jgi:hypothetical protein